MRLAERRVRETEDGIEPIEDPEIADRLWSKARRIHLTSIALALSATAIVLGWPG